MIYPWLSPTLTAMADLLKLEEGWDSYGAACISPLCVKATLDFLFDAMSDETPALAVVPTSWGGVLIEWHTGIIDLEIEFRPDGKIGCCYRTWDMSESFDDDNVQNFATLHPLVAKLAKRPKGTPDEQ